LIGEVVEVRLYAESLEVWYAQRQVESLPRLRGEGKQRIDYRHLIDWLVRKPGAFENYRYREELFPTSRFRMAYDGLKRSLAPAQASKEYLRILHLAAQVSETAVDSTLGWLIQRGELTRHEVVEQRVLSGQSGELATDVEVAEVDLGSYDSLLEAQEVLAC
jgi:hypothetical protein